ncbi:HIT domain-containing protein [Streptomyces sp. NPDC046976]|uniref:HIT family protein n=1 Tax=Streptomyces sp. NPDC046976 TaxID=3155258 RepID=UPI0033DCC1EF
MTDTTATLHLYRQLADLQRESDRLRIAVGARMAFEDVVTQHRLIGWDNPQEAAAIRQEAAEYLSGRRPVPPPVSSAELIAHARRRIEVFGRLTEVGVEGAAEGIVEAETELAEELRKVEGAGCAFCSIAAGIAPATVVRDWGDVLAIRPRSGGVNEGHLLVIPRTHVENAGTDPTVSGRAMECAAELMAEHPAANIITSKGAAATQTVYHLHIHVVPRAAEDGLPLPWTPQQTAAAARQTEEEK